jgi:hypothetical protein
MILIKVLMKLMSVKSFSEGKKLKILTQDFFYRTLAKFSSKLRNLQKIPSSFNCFSNSANNNSSKQNNFLPRSSILIYFHSQRSCMHTSLIPPLNKREMETAAAVDKQL